MAVVDYITPARTSRAGRVVQRTSGLMFGVMLVSWSLSLFIAVSVHCTTPVGKWAASLELGSVRIEWSQDASGWLNWAYRVSFRDRADRVVFLPEYHGRGIAWFDMHVPLWLPTLVVALPGLVSLRRHRADIPLTTAPHHKAATGEIWPAFGPPVCSPEPDSLRFLKSPFYDFLEL